MKKTIISGHSTVDGAGVKLFRVFANDTATQTDPFLLFDSFGSENPEDYIKGFPWHPHRGIETVTYVIQGDIEHKDSLGNSGSIKSGDIQWMSAGSGIIHQEMPKVLKGAMIGFQLWVNLPAGKKMMTPKYRGITNNEIPVVEKEGIHVKVIAGEYEGETGPVKDLAVDIEYLDISLDKGKAFEYQIKNGHTTFCFIITGNGEFDGSDLIENQLILLKDSPKVNVKTNAGLRFILASGKPLKEPIAWGGPIVMNTEEELEEAYKELREGTFIKK